MKFTKRVFPVLLALILALSLATAAFAAGNHTITINSKTGDHTYKAYQVFSGTYDSTSKKLTEVAWGTGVNGTELLTALRSDTTVGIDFSSCASADDVAKAIKDMTTAQADAFAAIVAQHITAAPTGTSTLVTGTTYQYTVGSLDDGYYFVEEDTTTSAASYTKYMLMVTDDVAVSAKTDVPSVTKKVAENNDATYQDKWNDAADYSIGDSVPFRLVGLVPDMANYKTYTYQFNDTLSSSLTFDANSVKVYFATGASMSTVNTATTNTGWTQIAAASGTTTNYTVEATSTGFTLKFSDLKTVTGVVNNGGYIVVEYSATLNSGAIVGNPGNPNEVTLTYSNNPNNSGSGTPSTGTTPKDEVVVFTYDLPVNKTDKSTKANLSGATFAIFAGKDDADAAAADKTQITNALKFTLKDGAYVYSPSATEGTTQTLADTNGAYSVKGLDQGTYYLVELTAPAGYNKLTAAQKIEIVPTFDAAKYVDGHEPDATGDQLKSYSYKLNETATDKVSIENASGSVLPATGGIGTRIFTFGGIALMLAAAVVFVTKRKASGEDR